MKASQLSFLTIQICLCTVAAESSAVVPDWVRYPFFFAGLVLLGLAIWVLLKCCCVATGLVLKASIVLLAIALVSVWAYFLFGPWWGTLNGEPDVII